MRIAVTGYSGCEVIHKVFFVVDGADFSGQVAKWELDNNICEWSQDVRR